MACEPTVDPGAHFPVAAKTETHLEINPLEPVPALHVPMALGAVEFRPLYVGDMGKEYKIGDPEYTFPRHGGIGLKVPLLPFDLGVAGYDVFMTEETFFHSRKTGNRRTFYVGMAEATVDLLNPCMDPVAERDGLERTYPKERKVKEEEHDRKNHPDRDRPEVAAPLPVLACLCCRYVDLFLFRHAFNPAFLKSGILIWKPETTSNISKP
jgi:hypothetical protein